MSSLPADPYKALGVSKDAPLAEIRSAHRKLVLQCHPDKVQDPKLKAEKADEFQRVQQAYEILSDENERQKYDEQAKMAELKRQLASKANTSSPRTSRHTAEFEIRTAEPRPSSYKTTSPVPRTKSYTTYSRSWDDEPRGGPRFFDTEIRTSSRRETSYNEKHSKRGDREKERDRERRKQRDEDARIQEKIAEKLAKEARRQERKKQEKAKDKEYKRESDRKRETAKPYVEPYDEDSSSGPKPEKKKSSSKKHDEKRERSSHREEGAPMPPQAAVPDNKYEYAASYIDAARDAARAKRSATYHATTRADRPPAPTPPIAPGQTSAYRPPDDDDEEEVRRSSARTRRGSSEVPRMGREKSYRKASRDPLAEGVYVVHSSSPKARHSGGFDGPPMSSSPRSGMLGRTSTMPIDTGSYSRPPPGPGITRAQTFSGVYADVTGSLPRGRERSRMHAQVEEDTEDSEDDYEQQRRRERSERKHRSRKHRSPSREYSRYNDSRPPLSSSYSRQASVAELEIDGHRYHPSSRSGASRMDSRPPQARGSSFSGHASAKYPNYKESKNYGYGDVAYSADFAPEYVREREAGMA